MPFLRILLLRGVLVRSPFEGGEICFFCFPFFLCFLLFSFSVSHLTYLQNLNKTHMYMLKILQTRGPAIEYI